MSILTHLSHEGRFAAHVGPGDQHTGGPLLARALALVLIHSRAANENVVGDKVIPKEGLGDARVSGTPQVQEGRSVLVASWEQHLWSYHGPISCLAVPRQAQDHIWKTKDAQGHSSLMCEPVIQFKPIHAETQKSHFTDYNLQSADCK